MFHFFRDIWHFGVSYFWFLGHARVPPRCVEIFGYLVGCETSSRKIFPESAQLDDQIHQSWRRSLHCKKYFPENEESDDVSVQQFNYIHNGLWPISVPWWKTSTCPWSGHCIGSGCHVFLQFSKTHTQHLVNKSYINNMDYKINRTFFAWCDYTMFIINKINQSGAYSNETTVNQYLFAKNICLRLIEGVKKQKMVLCTILLHDCIMMVVKGCDDPDVADLLVCISNFKIVNIFSTPPPN